MLGTLAFLALAGAGQPTSISQPPTLISPLLQTSPVGIADTLPDTLRVYQLMGLTVTAPRTGVPLRVNPSATSVVDARDLNALPRSIAVDEAVRLVPGLKVDNQADGARVHMSIRGQGILSEHGIRGIKILEDGLPLNDPSGFAADLYDIDWSDIARIEVLRGPGASLYGGGATAGVLNILTTEPPATDDLAIPMAEAHMGSHGFWKTTARNLGRSGDVGYSLTVSRAMGDGYREHTAFNATNVRAKADWEASDRLRVKPVVAYTAFFNQNAEGLNLAWLAENRRQANPDANTFNEFQKTHRFTGGFTGSYEVSASTSLDFNGYARATRYLEPVPSSVQHRTLFAPGGTVQLTSHASTGRVTHTLGGGADWQWQRIAEFRVPNLGLAREGSTLLSDETIHQSGLGVFLFDRFDLSRSWSGMVNLRYDRITNRLSDLLRAGGVNLSGKTNFDRATMRVGLAYSPSSTWSVYGNWGQGFLPPATEELANNPDAQGGFNRSLEPALSHGEELGVRGLAGRRLFYDVTLFHLETRGDFDRYRVPDRPLETFYRNGGNSRRFGAELYANANPIDPLWVRVAYTWSHFVYRSSTSFYGDIEGHRLPNSPDQQLFTDVSWRVLPNITLGAGTDTFSRWYVDAGNATSVDGYTLFNARVAWRVSLMGMSGEFSLQGRNLTSVKYIAFTEPDPDGNSYQPGPERELFAGLRISMR